MGTALVPRQDLGRIGRPWLIDHRHLLASDLARNIYVNGLPDFSTFVLYLFENVFVFFQIFILHLLLDF